MTLRMLACAGLFALASTAAAAQDAGGYYASLKVLGGLSNYDIGLKNESTSLVLFKPADEIVGGPSVALGYRMKNFPVRFEAEWIWRYRYDMNAYSEEASERVFKVNHSTQSLYANAYYDVPLTERWFTKGTAFGYVGAGIGVALKSADGTVGVAGGTPIALNNTEMDLTWMATIGFRYHFTKRWMLDVSYRFSDLGGMDTGKTALGEAINTSNYRSHDLLIGTAYAF